jgi:hypothetical protein
MAGQVPCPLCFHEETMRAERLERSREAEYLARAAREPVPGVYSDRIYAVTFEGKCYVHHLMLGRKGHGRGSK